MLILCCYVWPLSNCDLHIFQAADVNNIALLLQPMGLSKDGDNNLVWCSDAHFEAQVNSLDSKVIKT